MNEDWMSSSLCNIFHIDPNVFFPDRGMNDIRATAVRICSHCRVKDECLHYAIDHNIKDGVWGGAGYAERKRISITSKPDSLTG